MKFKKMLGVAMSVMMITGACAIPTMVSAATVSVSEGDTHTYDVYQVFKGKLSGKGFADVSQVVWGSGVDSTDLGSATDKVNGLTDANVKDFAKELVNGKLAAKSGSVSGGQTLTDLEDGYYLLVDTATNPGADAISAYMLKVAGDVTVNPKKNIPTVEKKVKDNDDDDKNWQDLADYSIGDAVPFQLTATLGSEDIEAYNKYRLVFHDTLSAGLTSNGDYKVIVGDNEYTSYAFADNGITVNTTDDGKITIVIADVKTLGATNGSKVVVEYTATLNDNAVIGEQGNPNTVSLSYSNNPNYVYDGSGNGDKTDDSEDDDDDQTGDTQEDTVLVLTYKLDVNKLDGMNKNAPLAGAKFALYKGTDLTATPIKEFTAGTETVFEFKGLDAGTYTLVETEAPAEYNKLAEPVTFEIQATHKTSTEANGNNITNLKATTEGSLTFTTAHDNSKISTDVVNYKGATLPETGGMGTRVIYTLGGLLVLGASVLLVTKRRMGENE